ncbi:coproporphyrinogen III oxidase, partial [Aliarcobacter butzleri]
LNTKRVVTHIHFGGGPPTFFSPSHLEVVITAFKEIFPNFSPDAEVSCEVAPGYFAAEHMDVVRAGGCNRLSGGVQDSDE